MRYKINYFKFHHILLLWGFSLLPYLSLNAQHQDKKTKPTPLPDTNKRSEKNRRAIVPQLLFSGVLLQNKTQKQVWYIPSLFELFPPNTIEGFVTNLHLSFTQYLSQGRFYNLKPWVRYGWGNQRIQAQLAAQFYYNPALKASVQLSGGRFVEQFNKDRKSVV